MKEITNDAANFSGGAVDDLINGLSRILAAINTLENNGYTYNGGELWKPPTGKNPNFNLIDTLNDRIKDLEDRCANNFLLKLEIKRLNWLIANMMTNVEDIKELEYDK